MRKTHIWREGGRTALCLSPPSPRPYPAFLLCPPASHLGVVGELIDDPVACVQRHAAVQPHHFDAHLRGGGRRCGEKG